VIKHLKARQYKGRCHLIIQIVTRSIQVQSTHLHRSRRGTGLNYWLVILQAERFRSWVSRTANLDG